MADDRNAGRVERAAVRASKSYFKKGGFKVIDDHKLHYGYDFAVEKAGRMHQVEVKGRTPGHGNFLLFSYQESQHLENEPNFRVALVLVNPSTLRPESVKILTRKDFGRSQKVAHPPVRWYYKNPNIAKPSSR